MISPRPENVNTFGPVYDRPVPPDPDGGEDYRPVRKLDGATAAQKVALITIRRRRAWWMVQGGDFNGDLMVMGGGARRILPDGTILTACSVTDLAAPYHRDLSAVEPGHCNRRAIDQGLAGGVCSTAQASTTAVQPGPSQPVAPGPHLGPDLSEHRRGPSGVVAGQGPGPAVDGQPGELHGRDAA